MSETTEDYAVLARAAADRCETVCGLSVCSCATDIRRAEAEITRLRTRLAKIANAPVPQSNALANTLKAWAMPRDGEYPYA